MDNIIKKPLSCEPCGFVCAFPSLMARHKRQKWHRRNVGEIAPVLSECENCSYKSYVRVNFTNHRKRCKAIREEKEEFETVAALVPLIEKRDKPAAITIAVLLSDIKSLNEAYTAAGRSPHDYFAYDDMMRKMGDMPRFTVLLEIRAALVAGLSGPPMCRPQSQESGRTPACT